MARVAVDAMGGDHAPEEIVAGALEAHRKDGIDVLLCGPRERVEAALAESGGTPGPGIDIADAPHVIAMDDADPALAVRRHRDASVSVAARLVRDGRADAMLSAGSTGAALAAGVLHIGRLRGVQRPAIVTVLPFGSIPTVLVDAGANADVRAEHLAHFALLGAEFARVRLGLDDPRVGLLSVGEEPGKGSEVVRLAYPLVEASGVRFIGNVEGRDIPTDSVDVVVTDGFTGNVVLKLLEGFAKFLMGELLKVFTATEEAKAASDILMPGLLDLAAQMSPDTYGGAQLLGVKGVCIIGHGSSGAQAVRAAVGVAAQTVDERLVERVAERLRS